MRVGTQIHPKPHPYPLPKPIKAHSENFQLKFGSFHNEQEGLFSISAKKLSVTVQREELTGDPTMED